MIYVNCKNDVNGRHFDQGFSEVPRATASQVIARTRNDITSLADQATHLAELAQEKLVEEASTAMAAQLDAEISRLRYLAEVNPNVSEAEVEHLVHTRVKLEQYIRAAQLKLEAVRVIVAT